ncbi:hypothetical protein E2562_010308 [Oryza meyeriana var. granulata]|uniref:Uncharacterized protein n=1 Tax=Oryza meyeriana var. granulata TaxID=110450 RepID=A0A6G1F678_9ORYZ|nr:hypothetical protein E2562_010308 [Oryza meyeriana var. granulata]
MQLQMVVSSCVAKRFFLLLSSLFSDLFIISLGGSHSVFGYNPLQWTTMLGTLHQHRRQDQALLPILHPSVLRERKTCSVSMAVLNKKNEQIQLLQLSKHVFHVCAAPHEDVTNLSAAELRRKRARERYASLSIEQKEARRIKVREYKQRRRRNHGLNRSATTDVTGNEPIQSIITPRCITINETAIGTHSTSQQDVLSGYHMRYACTHVTTSKLSTPANSSFSAPLVDITNLSANDLRRCQRETYDSLTVEQRKKFPLFESATTTGSGNASIFIYTLYQFQ